MVWNSPHFGGLGTEKNSIDCEVSASPFRQLVLENFIQRLQIGSPHNHSVDSWAKVTLEIRDSRGRSCFIHSTEVKHKGKGERTDLCGKCHLGCNLSLSELCLSEGLVTLWKSLFSGCYYCSHFPTKISLLSSLAMQLLAEKKQNLCVAARAAKLKVRVQRQIAASPGLGLELTRGTSHAPTRESARDLCRQTPGKKPKRKHPSKMQMGENRVSSSPLGLCRWVFLTFWDMAESAIPCVRKEQGKVNLKKLGNNFKLLCLPNCSNVFSMPDPSLYKTKPNNKRKKSSKKKKEEGKKKRQPKASLCWVQLVHWGILCCCATIDPTLLRQKTQTKKSPSSSEQRYHDTEHWCGEKYFMQAFEPDWLFTHMSKAIHLS